MEILKTLDFQSDRLYTRRLEETDATTLFEFYSDAEAMRFRGSGAMKILSDAYQMIAAAIVEEEELFSIRLGVVQKLEDALIGTVLLKVKKNQPLEFGFSFGKKYWGHGFAKESLRMVEEGLLRTKIDQLIAYCRKENYASIKIFEQAAYRLVPQERYPESILFEKELSKLI